MSNINEFLEIAKYAFTRAGAKTIDDLSDPESKAAKSFLSVYQITRKSLLRQHPWNFAKKRERLALKDGVQNPEYKNVFQLPPDYIAALKINEKYVYSSTLYEYEDQVDMDFSWEIEADSNLVSDLDDVRLTYIADIKNPDDYDPMFTEVLAMACAEASAYSLTGSESVKNNILSRLRSTLSNARFINAMEGNPKVDESRTQDFYNIIYGT